MLCKIIGAILILLSCGATGFYIAGEYIKEETLLRNLAHVVDFMKCELQYRLTPLPELCRKSADETINPLRSIFVQLSSYLDSNTSSDVTSCMNTVLAASNKLTPKCSEAMGMLGNCLGRFDLDGQLHGLEAVHDQCEKNLDVLLKDKQNRTRQYQTLGLCAGAALIIILL